MIDENIIKKMDHNFVENYEDVIKYKDKLNNILDKMGFKEFETYNEFCKLVRENAIKRLKQKPNNFDKFFSIVLNDSLRNKIKNDKNYKNKLSVFFNNKDLEKII